MGAPQWIRWLGCAEDPMDSGWMKLLTHPTMGLVGFSIESSALSETTKISAFTFIVFDRVRVNYLDLNI